VHGRHHTLKYRIEELACLLRVAVGQELQGAFEIGKEHRHVFALAFQSTAGSQNLLGEVWGNGGEERRFLAGLHGESGWSRRGGCWRGSRCPHQPPALFIDNLGMGKQEFFFQVFQHRVIEVELSFERAIGHALTTPEQVNDLVEQGIKGVCPTFYT
jgi:hypothetical protein